MVMDCLILGDSIAVGTIMAKPGCIEMAKGGINSHQWNVQYGNRPALDNMSYNYAIISLGSNDHQYVKTRDELIEMRRKVDAKRVYWILPAIKPAVQEIVREIARDNHDTVLEIRGLSKDGVHPTGTGYKDLAERAK